MELGGVVRAVRPPPLPWVRAWDVRGMKQLTGPKILSLPPIQAIVAADSTKMVRSTATGATAALTKLLDCISSVNKCIYLQDVLGACCHSQTSQVLHSRTPLENTDPRFQYTSFFSVLAFISKRCHRWQRTMQSHMVTTT